MLYLGFTSTTCNGDENAMIDNGKRCGEVGDFGEVKNGQETK